MSEQGPVPDVENDEDEPLGGSFTLTAEGWQPIEYAEPGHDWLLQEDGSYQSPDGVTRTWVPEDLAGNAVPSA